MPPDFKEIGRRGEGGGEEGTTDEETGREPKGRGELSSVETLGVTSLFHVDLNTDC